MKRRRYQYGCLTRKHHTISEDVWQFRFYETLPDGRRARRARVVGTVKQYPTRADALRAIEPFRVWLNLVIATGGRLRWALSRLATSNRNFHFVVIQLSSLTSQRCSIGFLLNGETLYSTKSHLLRWNSGYAHQFGTQNETQPSHNFPRYLYVSAAVELH
jgi:hypothetical protein